MRHVSLQFLLMQVKIAVIKRMWMPSLGSWWEGRGNNTAFLEIGTKVLVSERHRHLEDHAALP